MFSRSWPGRFLLLEADLPAASGNLTWLLRTVDGRTAMEGTAPAPELGLSFKLLVPAAATPQRETIFFSFVPSWEANGLFDSQTGKR